MNSATKWVSSWKRRVEGFKISAIQALRVCKGYYKGSIRVL